jgi:hypothetical protein
MRRQTIEVVNRAVARTERESPSPRRTALELPREPDNEVETDASGAPVLLRVGTLVGTLERMLEHRQEAITRQSESPGVLGYYAKEERALKASIAALTYHRATIEQLPHFVTVLGELVDELSELVKGPTAGGTRLAAVAKRAEQVLAEYKHLV